MWMLYSPCSLKEQLLLSYCFATPWEWLCLHVLKAGSNHLHKEPIRRQEEGVEAKNFLLWEQMYTSLPLAGT
jgi:hypothetical protein